MVEILHVKGPVGFSAMFFRKILSHSAQLNSPEVGVAVLIHPNFLLHFWQLNGYLQFLYFGHMLGSW